MSSASGASAEDLSVTCSVEIIRHLAEIASEGEVTSPPHGYWVNAGGDTLGPMTPIQIKRAIHKGELPAGLWVRDAGKPGDAPDWTWSEALVGLKPLPASPELRPDDLGAGLRGLLTGCWISDPVVTADHQGEFLVLLFDNGVLYVHLSVVTRATGDESFRIAQPAEPRWQVTGSGGPEIILRLPEVEALAPAEDFKGRVIDRNTIELELIPNDAPVVLRRM